jgi:hypothetical protein
MTRWGQTKPPSGARLNRGHSLTRGLSGLWLLNEGSGVPRDLVRGVTGATSGQPRWCYSSGGPGWNAALDKFVVADHPTLNPTDAFTIWLHYVPSSTGTAGRAFDKNTGNQWRLIKNGSHAWEFTCGGANIIGSINAGTVNTPHHVFATFNKDLASNQQQIWVDGRADTVGTNTSAVTVNASSLSIGGRSDLAANFFQGVIVSAGFWNRNLSHDEIRSITAQPYNMIEQPKTYFLVSSGGGAPPPPPTIVPGIINNPPIGLGI